MVADPVLPPTGADDPGGQQVRPGGGAGGGQGVGGGASSPVELLRLPGDLGQEQDQRQRGERAKPTSD